MLDVYPAETLNLKKVSTKTTTRHFFTIGILYRLSTKKNKPRKLRFRFEDEGFIHNISTST